MYYKIDYSRCRFIRIIMKQLGLLGCDEQEQPIIPAGVYAHYKCLTKYIYFLDILYFSRRLFPFLNKLYQLIRKLINISNLD